MRFWPGSIFGQPRRDRDGCGADGACRYEMVPVAGDTPRQEGLLQGNRYLELWLYFSRNDGGQTDVPGEVHARAAGKGPWVYRRPRHLINEGDGV